MIEKDKITKNISEFHDVDGFKCARCGTEIIDYSRREIDEDTGEERQKETRLIDADELLEEINQLKESPWFNEGKELRTVSYIARKEAVEIIEDLCIKQQPTIERPTGRWIPVSERLPEEHNSLFKNEFFDKTSDTVLVTVADRKGQRTTTYAHTIDGKWSCDLLKACSDYKITAWQPLPEPYKEGVEE